MRILITGGTGFVGRRLIAALSKEHEILVFSNENVPIRGVKLFVGDILNKNDLKALAKEKFDVVYHLAASLDESDPKLWDTNVEGTRALLELCKQRKLYRFIFMSPIGVLGETTEPAKEDDPYEPGTLYEQSKAEAERLVMEYGLRHQIPYTIIRATIIYGPNNFWFQILKAAKNEFPIIGSGRNLWHLVYIDDVIQGLVLALKPIAKNKIYHLASADPRTYQESYFIISKILGSPFPKRRMPVVIAKAAAFMHETSSKIRGKRPNVTKMRASIDRLVRNRIVSIEKAKRELGYEPKYDLEQGMRKTVEALKDKL